MTTTDTSEVNPLADMIKTDELDWIPLPEPFTGNYIKVLRISEETGDMSMLFKLDAGTVEVRHRHIGPANFLVLSGCVEIWGRSAGPGSWMYEPAGAIHSGTRFPVDTVLLSNSQGPIVLLDDDDNVTGVVDWQVFKAIVEQYEAERS
jgi:2,4'-dihydroxyacetophenone dioxygenase